VDVRGEWASRLTSISREPRYAGRAAAAAAAAPGRGAWDEAQIAAGRSDSGIASATHTVGVCGQRAAAQAHRAMMMATLLHACRRLRAAPRAPPPSCRATVLFSTVHQAVASGPVPCATSRRWLLRRHSPGGPGCSRRAIASAGGGGGDGGAAAAAAPAGDRERQLEFVVDDWRRRNQGAEPTAEARQTLESTLDAMAAVHSAQRNGALPDDSTVREWFGIAPTVAAAATPQPAEYNRRRLLEIQSPAAARRRLLEMAAQAEYNRAREQQRPRKRVGNRVVRSAAEIAAVRQGLEAAQEKRQQEEGDEKYRAPIAGELVAFIRAIRVFIREFTRVFVQVFIRVFNSIRLFL
jgi:hypothetical protein